MSFRVAIPHISWFWLWAVLVWLPANALAQEPAAKEMLVDPLAPVYVTTRIFQLTGPLGSYQNTSDQLFRMKTASLLDEEKWANSFKKTYPGLSAALLQTNSLRVFRTSKTGMITFGQSQGRLLQVHLNAAHSYGDGVTPGTQLVADIGVHFGNDRTSPPLTIAVLPIDVESGMTYYFAAPKARMSNADYAGFIRPGAPATAFAESEVTFVFAFSVDLDRPAAGPRQLNEQQSAALVKEAQKQVQPELTAALKQAGLGGKVQVRVEIAPDGKVTHALTHASTLPEMNSEAVAAARQWEFPPALFAQSKEPIRGLLSFEFAAAPKPAPKQP